MKTADAPLRKWLWFALFAVLFGPFILIYASGLLGIPIMDVPGFGIWFMGALTAAGAITFFSMLIEGIRDRRVEWGCLIILGPITLWWAYIFLGMFK